MPRFSRPTEPRRPSDSSAETWLASPLDRELVLLLSPTTWTTTLAESIDRPCHVSVVRQSRRPVRQRAETRLSKSFRCSNLFLLLLGNPIINPLRNQQIGLATAPSPGVKSDARPGEEKRG